ncbi:DNA polymerase III subunit beta [Pleurocapsa sp. CCALA 161]|uniref:DNA polymerase III subunit beta n=1 Tax=Pleurocapsa sp. CCALA 161 TaxID=2107688 RepID=UPI000D050166|nr:DNA polymerase III subunit beta [Pleurocapsa sp. CCALA 161]PSB11589.1 DNA polymerase III subunit beta [Pleurocapsa sp. CCALA 161]
MQLIINTYSLQTALIIVCSNLKRNLQPSILNNVLLEARKNELKLTTFDGSQLVCLTLEAQVSKDAQITVCAWDLKNLVEKIKNKAIEILLHKDQLIIKSDSVTICLKTISANEFITLPQLESKSISIKLKRENLLAGIEQTLHCASKELSKQILTGINLKLVRENKRQLLKFCATDAHQLAALETEVDLDNTAKEFELIIQSKTMNLLSTLLKADYSSIITLTFDETLVEFSTDKFVLTCNQILGNYPQYEKLIPDEFEIQAIVDRQQMIKNLTLVNSVAQDNLVSITISPSQQQINIQAQTPGIANGNQTQSGYLLGNIQAQTITLNHDYLLKSLKSLPGSEVKILINQPNQPIEIQNLVPEPAQHIIMPVQVRK